LVTSARFLRFCVCFLFLYTASPRATFCQVIDELTGPGRSALKDIDFTPETVSALKEKAANGDAKSQYVLGWLYFLGQSVDKNNDLAVQWMTKAANQDFKFAQTQLGLMYLSASDFVGNYVLAREWLLKGASRGEDDALNALGVIYSQGLGVTVNGELAVTYFRKAADDGFGTAQYNLGYQYYVGKLVPQDYKEAAKLFQQAAQQDHVRAAYSLGVMYRDGQGVPEDGAEAIHLFQTVAEKHRFPLAEHNLGAMYYSGKLVPQNLVLAYMWTSLAANAGTESSKKLLATIGEKMTPEQIAEAKQKAQDWTRAHGS
jgi:TPR repeat protein